MFLRGTLEVATHGCSFATRLIVTGPARGRLFNVDYDGWNGLYVVEDADFLAWYERWLDEAVAGYDVGLFGERLPLDEPGLIAVLTGDPSPARRVRAGGSLKQLPELTDSAWTALVESMTTDVDAAVRAGMWNLLRWNEHRFRRRLDDAEAVADDIERYARSRTPPDLGALRALRRFTLADVLPALAGPDLERRRWTAHWLARFPWDFGAQDLPDDVVRGLLGDPDAFLRSYGVEAVGSYDLTHLHPLLRELQATETDPWVRYRLGECLAERPAFDPAVQGSVDEPPF
jgi:hypothetical protein